MNDEILILIADDNVEFGNLLCEYIESQEGMKIAGIARDGRETVEMITDLMPDIVILDIIMPNLDGIGVLEKVADMNLKKRPLFIMLSAIGQDRFIQKTLNLGAEYFIVKPFDVELLVSRIRQIYKERYFTSFTKSKTFSGSQSTLPKRSFSSDDLEVEVTNLMRDIGVPPHMSGYQYVREAIIQTVNDGKVFNSVTKVLYPSVAKKFDTSPQRVERAIRNAIETTWVRGNHDTIDSLFGGTINYSKGKPTNSEFIAMMATKIRLYMSKK